MVTQSFVIITKHYQSAKNKKSIHLFLVHKCRTKGAAAALQVHSLRALPDSHQVKFHQPI
jgi:hypothetical protein